MRTSSLSVCRCGLAVAILALGSTGTLQAENPSAPIPFPEIGAKATADYQGDALGVMATPGGARLRCGFQKLEGRATAQGFWLESSVPSSGGRFRLTAAALGRESSGAGKRRLDEPAAWGPSAPADGGGDTVLEATGRVEVTDKLVRFTRPGVTEEYSVSVDGVRQDFVIPARPAGAGDLRVELALTGARAEGAAYGARLVLEGSGRALAYSRLRAVDAAGRELMADLEVLSPDRLAVRVADANAAYPVRIDPTFSDANWVSLNTGMPGADSMVAAVAVDGSGSVYVCGGFTVIGTVVANGIAKWNGSAWSALGSGMDGYVSALAVSGATLYAGGSFTNAGGVTTHRIAAWNGSAWSALGSGVNSSVSALAVSGTTLYAGGDLHHGGRGGGHQHRCMGRQRLVSLGRGDEQQRHCAGGQRDHSLRGWDPSTQRARWQRPTSPHGTAAPGQPWAQG